MADKPVPQTQLFTPAEYGSVLLATQATSACFPSSYTMVEGFSELTKFLEINVKLEVHMLNFIGNTPANAFNILASATLHNVAISVFQIMNGYTNQNLLFVHKIIYRYF